MCGTYNDDTTDDFTMRNGAVTEHVHDFGDSWEATTGTPAKQSSLNIFIALVKHRVGPQVFPTLVTAPPLQCTYKT